MSKSVYVCKQCGSCYYSDSGSLSETCDFCKIPIIETDADPEEYLNSIKTPKEQKQAYNREFFAKYIEPYGQFDREAGAFMLMEMGEITQAEYEQTDAYRRVQAIVKANTIVPEVNVPKCPTCGSTNISSISGLERAGSIAMWGLFSKKINKSFKCKNCGYTW